jgi:ATP-binding cassette subfamily B protein
VWIAKKPPKLELPDPIPMTPGDGVAGPLHDRIQAVLDDGEDVVVVAKSDLGPDGNFGEQWLVVTSRHLFVFGPEAEQDGAPHLVVALEDVEGSAVEMQVGRAILQVTMGGEPRDVLGYSHSCAAAFNKLSRAIDDLAKSAKAIDVPKLLKADEDDRVCQNCGRVLPPWSANCPACVKKGQILRRLAGYLRPYWYIALTALIVSFGGATLELAPPYLMKQLVDKVLVLPRTGPVPTTPERLAMLMHLVVLLFAVRIGGTLLQIAHGYIMVWLGGRITFDVRSNLYSAMQHLALKFFDKKETGGLMSATACWWSASR